jgi:hypothetical protein
MTSERMLGYFQSPGMRRSSTAYVTTERIIVNKSRGQFPLRAHILTTLLVGFAPFVPTVAALAIILVVVAVISIGSLKNRRAWKKSPTIREIEDGIRLFEVNKRQVLSIEIKQPGKLRPGSVEITSLASGVFSLKMARGKAFRVANSLMTRFDPDRVRVSR